MDERTEEDFNQKLSECSIKSVSQTMENIGGVVSEDDTTYVKQEMSFIDTADMTPRQVVLYSTRTCSCGRPLGKKNPVEGRCRHRNCTNYTCGECVNTCHRCKRNFCSRHVIRLRQDEAYCLRCLPVRIIAIFLKAFFNPDYERKKE